MGMKLPVTLHQPFGPFVLESECPLDITNSINDFVDNSSNTDRTKTELCYSGGNIPNLLLRDFETIFLRESFCEEIGLKQYLENLGNYYMSRWLKIGRHPGYEKVKLSIIEELEGTQDFKYSDRSIITDSWVNRYYSGDYTPLHEHGADLAGIVILKYPEEELIKENTHNKQSEGREYIGDGRKNGQLQFIEGNSNKFSCPEYYPEQFVGQTLIFPSWLQHLVYPMKTNSERRTLSFNLVSEETYYERKERLTEHGLI